MKRLMIAVLILPQLVCASPAQRFTDVPVSHPYYVYIERLAELGIVGGHPDGHFGPDDPTYRYHAAIMIIKAMGIPYQHYDEPSFDDVPPSLYYYFHVEEMFRRGITSGCGLRLFCPLNVTTRAQAAVLLVRATGNQPLTSSGTLFTDVNAGTFGAGFIEKLFQIGGTHGCNEVQFCPDSVTTRAEFCAMVVRAFNL